MMNNDMLANIEYLREKANVSYEEAEQLLQRYDGNVMRALVELERQGRVYTQAPVDGYATNGSQSTAKECDGAKRVNSFVKRAFQTKLVVEKKGEEKTDLVADVPVPVAAAVTVCAPWLVVATAGLAFLTGHNVKIDTAPAEDKEEK